jgi:hypothetical protein
MDIKQQTQNVANQGRYGDSMLLHVNPAEVKGLAQAMPITVNPETGQPEAFLPFLAPLLGSMGMTALGGAGLLGTGAIGTAIAASPALMAGIGAGLGTYAQTGGSGSKALLSGLTAGFGTSALGNAANPNLASDIGSAQAIQGVADGASQVAANLTPAQLADGFGGSLTTQASQQAVANAAMPTAGQSIQTAFSGGFDEGAKTLANAAMTPSGMMAGTALGGRSIINSQELYEQQMRQFEEDKEQRRRDMYANNPEVQLYSASGGITNFQGGGDTDYDYESNKMQVYAPVKTQYQVNPDFMAGFAPETMYFRPDTINSPSMSTLGGSVPTLGADTYTGTKGGYDYEGSVDAGGNYTAGTAQGVQFAPQTSIDPYAAFTGSAPQGLVQSAYNPYPVQPMSMSPIDNTEDTSDYTDAGGTGEDGDGGGGNVGGGGGGSGTNVSADGGVSVGPVVGGTTNTGLSTQDLIDDYLNSQGITTDVLTGNNPEILDYIDSSNIGYDPTLDLGIDASIAESMGGNNLGMSGNAEINPSAYLPFSQDFFQPQDVSYTPPALDNSFQPQDFSYIPQDVSYTPQNPSLIDNYSLINNLMDNSSLMDNSFTPDGPMGRAQGGVTNYANQGQIEMMSPPTNDFRQDPITQEVIAFLMGDSENTEVVEMFVDKYGNETFMALREMILNPDGTKQTEGLIAGVGNGGMDDDLLGSIGNKEKIAVSQDEFIIPADVVSGLGDGSSNAGSKELYAMMDRIRQKRTGTTKQPTMLANAGGFLPA